MTVKICRWGDRSTWNDFVASTPHTHFQQSWEWGDLAPDLGSRAVRLAAIREGKMVGAAQVFINTSRPGNISSLYIPRGPLMLSPSIEILGPLLDNARLLGSDIGAAGIRLEPNAEEKDETWAGSLAALGFHPSFPPVQPRSSWMLDVTPNLDTLLANMKQKTRYNVRLAARKGVEVYEARPEDLGIFYELYRETARRDDFFIHDLPIYVRMFDLFRRAGNFCMLFARYGSEVIAAVTLVKLGSTCWYLHGASSNQHRNLMATYLLQWEGIQQAKRWGCALYDFRGVPDVLREDQDMYGVYRFKEGFGGFQYTTLDTWSAPYRPTLFGLWQLYFRARFDMTARQRRRNGLPARQFA